MLKSMNNLHGQPTYAFLQQNIQMEIKEFDVSLIRLHPSPMLGWAFKLC